MPTDRIVWTGADLPKEISRMGALLRSRIGSTIQHNATNGQNYMRKNAPWTDRTANARQGLFAQSFSDSDQFVIVMYHTMPYGIWLEVRNSGRFKIIEPAIQQTGRDVMNSISKILERMGAV